MYPTRPQPFCWFARLVRGDALDRVDVAIDPDELGQEHGDEPVTPDWFFLPGTADIRFIGRIDVEGDTHLIDDNFTVS